MRLPQPPLLLITDRRQARAPLEEAVAAAIRGGCRWISLREKDLPAAERCDLLRRLIALGRPAGATVMVHEDIEAAVAAGADGVHLPAHGSVSEARRRLGSSALIGISAHSLDALAAAEAAGADYATLSPIFPSASKPGYGPALGPAMLADAARRVAIPVIALGGIDAGTTPACLAAGAAGVAVMGGVMAAADPADAAARLLASMQEAAWTS